MGSARRERFDAYAARFRVNAVRRKNVDDAVARASEPGGMKKARRVRRTRSAAPALTPLTALAVPRCEGAGRL